MKKKKFLFGKRSKKKSWAPRMWDIIGGHSLENEAPLDTIKREAHEETGITVLHAQLITSIDVWDKSDNAFFKYYIYMITEWKGKPVNRSGEHTKIRWFTRDELNHKKIAVREYLHFIDEWNSEII